MDVICPVCGTPNDANSTTCSTCGAALASPEAGAPAQQAPGARTETPKAPSETPAYKEQPPGAPPADVRQPPEPARTGVPAEAGAAPQPPQAQPPPGVPHPWGPPPGYPGYPYPPGYQGYPPPPAGPYPQPGIPYPSYPGAGAPPPRPPGPAPGLPPPYPQPYNYPPTWGQPYAAGPAPPQPYGPPTQVVPPYPYGAPPYEGAAVKPRRKMRTSSIIILVVVLLLVAGGGVAAYLLLKGESKATFDLGDGSVVGAKIELYNLTLTQKGTKLTLTGTYDNRSKSKGSVYVTVQGLSKATEQSITFKIPVTARSKKRFTQNKTGNAKLDSAVLGSIFFQGTDSFEEETESGDTNGGTYPWETESDTEQSPESSSTMETL